jgi:surface protein
MDLNIIRHARTSAVESKIKGVNSISIGYKSKSGVITKEISIVFGVEKKIDLSQLLPEQQIPQTIEVGTYSIKTDVIERGLAVALSNPCFDFDNSFFDWQLTTPENQGIVRPLRGGVSITNTTGFTNSIGTLGFIAIDGWDGTLVGITNNHVVVRDSFLNIYKNNSGVITNLGFSGSQITNVYRNFVSEPSPWDRSGLTAPSGSYIYGDVNTIGGVKRYWPIHPCINSPGTNSCWDANLDNDDNTQKNRIDLGVVSLDGVVLSLTSSYLQLGLSHTYSLDFATTSEIDNLLTTHGPSTAGELFSSGRTTGAKGEGNMKLKIVRIDEEFDIIYQLQGASSICHFERGLVFSAFRDATNWCPWPISGGDSGSALIADFGGTRKIIGLVFAGISTTSCTGPCGEIVGPEGCNSSGYPPRNSQGNPSVPDSCIIEGIACRIDDLANIANIRPWLGETDILYGIYENMELLTTKLFADSENISVNSKRFFQLGITSSVETTTTTSTTTTESTPTITTTTNTTTINPNSFISFWQVSQSELSIELPLFSSGTYSFSVDWGDGTTASVSSYFDRSHTYQNSGIYRVSISGSLIGWNFKKSGSSKKITSILNWGNVLFGNLEGTFYGCENLNLSGCLDYPDISTNTNLSEFFWGCSSITTINNITGWDFSSALTLEKFFYGCENFNQDLNSMDVSSVENFGQMFLFAKLFNGNISDWDTSSATNMGSMFKWSNNFNSNIGTWNVGSVVTMDSMFESAFTFSQNLSSWCVSNILTKPNNFDLNAPNLLSIYQPLWGTSC